MLAIVLPVLAGACWGDPFADDGGATEETAAQAQELTVRAIAVGGAATWLPQQRGGAWWGDVATPRVNQVWGEVLNPVLDRAITTATTFRWTCRLPQFSGSRQSLRLDAAQIHVDAHMIGFVDNPPAGADLSFVFDPARYSTLLAPGTHEIRLRCLAVETTGSETGEKTAVSVSFPVQLYGGTTPSAESHGRNVLDNHGWYSRKVGYVYARILEANKTWKRTLSGRVVLKLRAAKAGNVTIDHFMVKVDGVTPIARMVDGTIWNKPAEFHGTDPYKEVEIDTAAFCNGRHLLAMHAHGLEVTGAFAGKQLASQVEIPFSTSNFGAPACAP